MLTPGRAGRYRHSPRKTGRSGNPETLPASPSLESRNRLEFLEGRREGVRQTPNGSRPELLVLRLEIQVMYGPCKMLWSFESALDERLVNHYRQLCQNIT